MVHLGSFVIMILTENNISNQYYFRNRLGYDVVCLTEISTTAGGAHGGVGLFVRDRPQFLSVQLTRFHGLNMVSFKVISSDKRTLLVIAYLPPSRSVTC